MTLEPIQNLGKFEREDVELLSRAAAEELGGVDAEALATMLNSGAAIAWRFVGDNGERGIFVTTFSTGGEFFFWMLSGRGLLKNLEWIYERFEEYARKSGARWMTGVAKPALARIYEAKLGFRLRNIQVIKEL